MAKMIDNQCNVEFPSDAAYLVHKKAGHIGNLEGSTPIEAPPVPTPPPGVPAGAMPSPELMEQIQRIENKKDEKPATGDSTPSQHPSSLPPAVPLVLEYVWKGEHEKCRRQPGTLKLEVGGKFFSVAYCESCKEQLASKEVANLWE
jgi:hypothetical protein